MCATRVDTIVDGWYVVTMNPSRDIIHYGSVALRDGVVVAVEPTLRSTRDIVADRRLGGARFVVTPGLVNSHIHITGEPLTRGYVPDDTPFEENVFGWLCPLYAAHGPADERISAQLAATEMLRTGTTTFLEAGTIRFLDEVFEGLAATGIRGRLSRWVWDLPPDPDVYRQRTDEAIGHLQAPTRVLPQRGRWAARRMVDGDRPHDVLRSAVAGGAASWPTSTASG